MWEEDPRLGSPETKARSLKAARSRLAKSLRHRAVQSNSPSGIHRGGLAVQWWKEPGAPTPARARSPRPAACAPLPTPVQPSLPRRPGSQNASQKWVCLPPAEPHVRTREDPPHGARDRSARVAWEEIAAEGFEEGGGSRRRYNSACAHQGRPRAPGVSVCSPHARKPVDSGAA